MREIKFRGKLLHSKQWIEGNLVIANNGQPYIIPSDILDPDGHHLRIDSDDPFWVSPKTVGQFTGQLDKNGKEIYEGDILRVIIRSHWRNNEVISNSVCPVLFQNGMFGVIHGIRKEFLHFKAFSYNVTLEVVGNIHDNPELLKP